MSEEPDTIKKTCDNCAFRYCEPTVQENMECWHTDIDDEDEDLEKGQDDTGE